VYSGASLVQRAALIMTCGNCRGRLPHTCECLSQTCLPVLTRVVYPVCVCVCVCVCVRACVRACGLHGQARRKEVAFQGEDFSVFLVVGIPEAQRYQVCVCESMCVRIHMYTQTHTRTHTHKHTHTHIHTYTHTYTHTHTHTHTPTPTHRVAH
jgi:ABC-type nickel/cobalt efflux system permease component RcnA